MTLMAYTDGASRGNPGDSGIGLIVRDETGREILSLHGYIGRATNNAAEYAALLALLKKVKTMGCSRLVAHSDSELMVRQVNGQYRVRDKGLKKHFEKTVSLLKNAPFEFTLVHIPREQNAEADRLANMGIDSRKRLKV
jgi:ribonuclease HI